MRKIRHILLLLTFAVVIACSSDDPTDDIIKEDEKEEVPKEDDEPASDYIAPSYADDYSSIAGWNNRSKWNLANVHDPTVVFDGTHYYMYSTDASYGNAHDEHGHFPYRRSKDLVNWEFMGMSMKSTPAWVKDTLNNMRAENELSLIENPRYGHWAPVVRKVGGKYRMYYSIIIDNYIKTGLPNTAENFDGSWTEHAFIGMRETDNLESNIWTDKGMVIHSVSDRGKDWSRASANDWSGYFKWNAIDPSYVETPEGEHWLIYGSWHSGIVAVEVNPETGKPYKLETLEDYGVRIARRQDNNSNRWQAQEAPEIIYNDKTGYYYLFLAYDELSVAYNTRVARSKNVTGPYLGINGANVTQGADCWPMLTHPYKFSGHSGWVGFSHCAVFQNEESGDWFYTSQARLPENTGGNAYSNAIMMGHVNRMAWTEDGWPVVLPERYAAVPQDTITKDVLVGKWEVINMKYEYRKQQTSVSLVLNNDGTATGGLSGKWSYDDNKKIVTIGSQKLYVGRELDWEAKPRVPTIVMSGITNDGKPIWGKRVK